MSEEPQVVFDAWNAYPAERDGILMFIAFDDALATEDPPEDLSLCARVVIPIKAPNEAGGPVEPEHERLWDMEDALVETLQEHKVHCRLVARLTYDGLREIVFQVHDWESFRPPVGRWIRKQGDYEVDVIEHEGWGFYDEYIRPRLEDEMYMADQSVVDGLIESGSDPEKEHALEYAFMGGPDGLRRLADELQQKGYVPVGDLDVASGQIVLAKNMKLDLAEIIEESLANFELAEEADVEFDGWGAAVVS